MVPAAAVSAGPRRSTALAVVSMAEVAAVSTVVAAAGTVAAVGIGKFQPETNMKTEALDNQKL